MSKKQILISSAGLKNIVLNKNQEDEDFIFVFGEQVIQMKSIFAEFISPVVSRLHQTDPTINKINFGESNANDEQEFKKFCQNVLSPEIIAIFGQISSGCPTEIDGDQAIKLRFLSILLENEELYQKLDEIFPQYYSEDNVNSYLQNIQCCCQFSHFRSDFDYDGLLSFISNHFYLLNKDNFLKLPRKLQYEIITHPDLQIETEDSLFDIIIEIIENKKEKGEIDDIMLLEEIEFTGLSEEKLRTFFDYFDFNEMNFSLWNKFVNCLFYHFERRYKPAIIVGGLNENNILSDKSNNKNEKGENIISPPVKSFFDPASLQSFSVYNRHSVLISIGRVQYGIGYNKDFRISSTLAKSVIDKITEFTFKGSNGNQLDPISTVCCEFGTLYMLSKGKNSDRQLVYCSCELNEKKPIFLDIGNQKPVALFGGYSHMAAINDKGEVIFINSSTIRNSNRFASISLPDSEMAVSVACLKNSVYVLSTKGHVFWSPIEKSNNDMTFSEVSDLASEEIICLSGTNEHCFVVNNEGCVFAFGSNNFGQLGIGEKIEFVSSFREIMSLRKYKIRAAYAGCRHSLFETREGRVLSCGYNANGQLLLKSGPSKENVYTPMETTIIGGANFCIAGDGVSAVFVGCEPPLKTPNKMVLEYK